MSLLMVFLMLLFCIPAYAEYAEVQSIAYSEPYGLSLRADMDCTETEHAAYFFEKGVSVEDRAACIDQTEKLLEQLPEKVYPEICVFAAEHFSGVRIDGERLYIAPMSWQSIDYAALILQTCCGRYSHYGLAYGYACVLQGQSAEFMLPENLATCDLNLLCFDDTFVSATDVQAARMLACNFAETYIREYGDAVFYGLLSRSDASDGMREVAEALQSYYTQHGLRLRPAEIRISHGGAAYQYCVMSDSVEFFVGRKWQDVNWEMNPLVSEYFLHERYEDVREFFQVNETQMHQYRQLLGLCDNGNLLVILPNSRGYMSTSAYQAGAHQIVLLNVDSLMHEYIHALAQPNGKMELWETEGFARYFSYYYDRYGIAFLNQDYNNAADTAALRYVHEYLSRIERPIDMAIDYGEIESVRAYALSFQTPNESYAAGAAFVHYLVQRYGEGEVIRHVCDGAPLQEGVSVLTNDWKQWLDERYEEYSKYITPQPLRLPPGKRPPEK